MDYYALPLLTVWILSAIGFSSCQNEPLLDGPLNGAVGGNVVFNLTNPPSEPPTTIIWTFIKDGNQNGIFGSVGGGVPDINDQYKNRISVDSSTASLELRNLTLNDTGEYNLKLSITGGGVTTSLTVFERITNVQAEASLTDPVEFNSSVILTCSASGTSPSFRWLNNSAEVTGSDRVLLGNNTLTLLNVTRYDKGPYQCNASNIFSAEISPPPGVILTIAYGPDSSVVTVTPEGPYISGSNITLSCSSESSPAAQLQWALNGTLLGKEGPELRLENIQTGQSGAYSCWAYNSKTQRYKISAPTNITVLERITNVQAEASQTDLVEFNSSVILTCSASGSSPSFRWLNNSAEVTGSDRVLLDKNNLTVLNVTRYDKGPYQCTASNIISAETSPSPGVILTIAYGPDSPVVTVKPEGPYISGSNITLSCFSKSSPAAQFQWALNGTLLGKEGPELRLENIETGQSGDYSCWAYNSKTQRYKTSAPTSIIVQEKGLGGGSHGGFPAWAIAVIVIVVLIGIAATIGISFYVVKKKKKKGPSGNQQASDQNNGSVELNYADITQFQKRNGQRQDLGNHRDEGTEYAAVKLPGYTRPYQPGQSQVGHVNSQNTPRAGPPAYGSRGQAPASPNQIPDVTYAQVMRR